MFNRSNRRIWAVLLCLCNYSVKTDILPNVAFSEKLTQKLTPTRKNKLDRVLSLPSFLYGLPHDLGGLTDTLLVRMGIHPQGHGLVAMAQGLAD